MKKFTNEKLISRNKTIGNVMSIAGIVILAVGLILNFNPTETKILLSFGALIVGFVVSQISTYFVNRFGRSPRFDELIADNLDKLDNNYTFYVYSAPVPMLLVGPEAIWIPIPIFASGEITYDTKWRQKGGSFMMKFFGQESLGRPEMDVKSNEKEVYNFLSEHLSEDEMPPIKSMLVSMHPKAIIGDVENAPIPITEVSALRRKLRKYDRKTANAISPEVREKINALLSS